MAKVYSLVNLDSKLTPLIQSENFGLSTLATNILALAKSNGFSLPIMEFVESAVKTALSLASTKNNPQMFNQLLGAFVLALDNTLAPFEARVVRILISPRTELPICTTGIQHYTDFSGFPANLNKAVQYWVTTLKNNDPKKVAIFKSELSLNLYFLVKLFPEKFNEMLSKSFNGRTAINYLLKPPAKQADLNYQDFKPDIKIILSSKDVFGVDLNNGEKIEL